MAVEVDYNESLVMSEAGVKYCNIIRDLQRDSVDIKILSSSAGNLCLQVLSLTNSVI